MRTGRKTIAVLLDYIGRFLGNYQTRIQNDFEDRCRELDLDLLLVFGGAIHEPLTWTGAQNTIFELVGPECADGLIAISSPLCSNSGPEALCRLLERYRSLPCCSLGLELPGTVSVTVDNRSGMDAILEHIIRDHGRRRIAFITGPPQNPEAEARLRAYRDALARHRLPFDPALIENGKFVHPGGLAAMERLFERGVAFDAVVAANDNMALGAMVTLRQHRVRVPEDVPVTGFDDLPTASVRNPPLTTVAQPFRAMVECSIQAVLHQMEGRSVTESIRLPPELVVRRSCGCHARQHRRRPENTPGSPLSAPEWLCREGALLERELAGSLRVGSREGDAAAARLITALREELAGERDSFVRVFEEMLGQAGNDAPSCSALESALDCLRDRFRALALPQLEDLWDQARGLIGHANAGLALQHRIELDQYYVASQSLVGRLTRALDLPSLKQALVEALPELRVQTAFVSRFPRTDAHELEPLVCVVDGVPQEDMGGSFAAGCLFPPRLYPEDRRHSFVAFPLVFETQRLGLAVFENAPGLNAYEGLRDAIAAALRSVGLYQEVMEKTILHERSVQERLATTKRLQSLSVLAGGVAHDLNNALGPLLALPDIILRELDEWAVTEDAEVRADVEVIRSAALRAAQTIKDLLTLGRQGRAPKESLDLNRLFANLVESNVWRFPREPGRRVDVIFELAAEPLIIRGSEPHLVRALTNLVRNAAEAIPGQGEVVLKTFATCVTEPISGYETVDPGQYVVITVSDTGSGISASDLGRVFEPFFSKKRLADSSGTGLGLAIVHGVVKDHDGFVDVSSALGRGTTFSLYFPRHAGATSDRPHQTAAAASGRARILIVDDEPIQLRTGRRVLERLGYSVDTFQSGEQAYALFAEAAPRGDSPYDLVILDMILNEDHDGLELYDMIQRLFPEQRAILASGHAPSERAELAITKGLAWLVKPYSADDLGRAVAATLAATSGRQPSQAPAG